MAADMVVGAFNSSQALLAAARAAREQGLKAREAFTPFPVHGMDEALRLKPSRLPAACLGFGLAGLILGVGFQEWVFLVDWPMNIGGKADNAWPAYVPVSFELTVLFAGVGTALAFFLRQRLGPTASPAAAGLGATDDKFVLALERTPSAREFLKVQGASDIRDIAA